MTPTTQNYRTGRAVFAIVASVFALSLGDALIKATGLSLPLWQMYILRSALTVPVLWWLARRGGPITIYAPGWVMVRSGLLVVMWLCYYVALPQIPLSLAAAAYYTGPIFIVVLSAILARRWPTGRALAAISAGFVVVLVFVQPDAPGFQAAVALPIFAAFLYACAMILTSAKCRDDSPLVLALSLNIAFIVAGGVLGVFSGQEGSFIFGAWQPIDLALLGTVAALACLVLVGSVGAAIAYQDGPPATIAVFDYSYIAFSVVWGILFFDEVPEVLLMFAM